MGYYWKVVETRSELLQNKLNELQAAGCEIIKIDLLSWDEKVRSGTYNIIARQAMAAPTQQPHMQAFKLLP
jgi:hypothetical protein